MKTRIEGTAVLLLCLLITFGLGPVAAVAQEETVDQEEKVAEEEAVAEEAETGGPLKRWATGFREFMAPVYAQADRCVQISNKTMKGKLKKECEALGALVQERLDHPEGYVESEWNAQIRSLLHTLKSASVACLKKEPFMSNLSSAQQKSQKLFASISQALKEEAEAGES